MRETMFDDSYNIREVLDDVIERVTLREKLISTAKQFAEKKREDMYTLAIKQFENLMGDFLRLYQPILDRLGSYRQGLQKELSSLKSSLATVTGMLEVSKGIEGSRRFGVSVSLCRWARRTSVCYSERRFWPGLRECGHRSSVLRQLSLHVRRSGISST